MDRKNHIPANAPCFLCDLSAIDEAAGCARAYWALDAIDDEKSLLSSVKSLDTLLGRKNTPRRLEAVVRDRTRSFYIDVLTSLSRETKMTMWELDRALQDVVEVLTDGRGRIDPLSNANQLMPFLMKWLRHAKTEPRWHLVMRGDTRPLPASKNKDLWGYLRELYCDPEKVRLREPDYVHRLKALYPGYEDCLGKARAAAKKEMRRRYGQDVDLSPVTDLPRRDSSGEKEFVDMLKHGGIRLGCRPQGTEGSPQVEEPREGR